MRNGLGAALVLCLCLFGCGRPERPPRAALPDSARAELEARLATQAPAGALLLLFDAEGELALLGSGYADAERGIRFDAETRLRLGELSELLVAALALRCSELGLLALDAPLGRVGALARLPPGSPAGERVAASSPREILSQLTGLRAEYALQNRGYDPAGNAELFLRDAPVLHPPGAFRSRGGALVDLLALHLASLRGASLESTAAELLWRPLGLRSASYERGREDALYAKHYKHGVPLTEPEEPPFPSLSFTADARDLSRFFALFLPARAARDGPTEASFRSLLSFRASSAEGKRDFGFPWRLRPPGLAYLGEGFWYSGKYLAHRSCLILLPDLGLGVLGLSNAWAWKAEEFLYEASAELLRLYAAAAFGLSPPTEELEAKPALPPGLGKSLEGLYATELGPLRLRLDEEQLVGVFEGIEWQFEVMETGGLLARGGPIRSLQPQPGGEIEVEFAEGRRSLAGPRLEPKVYPPSWAALPGLYRRQGRSEVALPYALEIGLTEGIYTLAGGDGRALVLLPAAAGEAAVFAGPGSAFFERSLRLEGPGRLRVGATLYLR